MTEIKQIKIAVEVRDRLKELRLTPRESYSEVIERLIDDHNELKMQDSMY